MKNTNLLAIIFCLVLLVNAFIACVCFTSITDENEPTTPATNFEEPTVTPEIPSEPTADSTLTVEEGVILGSSQEDNSFTESKYYITGIITEISNSTHGNMRITDKTGKVLTIYGTWNADGTTRYDKLNVKPVVGDTVTIYGVVGRYNGVPQLKNGWIVAHTPAAPEETSSSEPEETSSEPTTEPVTDPTTGSNPVDPDQPEPHEHSYKAVVTDPTCEAAGYTTYTCSCGHSYIEDGEASLGHVDANTDHKCDRNCGKTDMGTCVDADKDHNCDYGCDKSYGTCADTNKDHACDYGCQVAIGEHKDTNKDHACDYGCQVAIGEHKDTDKDHACDYGCNVTIGTCADANKDHACDYGCDKTYGEHKDKDKDHACDYGCQVAIGEHKDADKDHACDYGCDKTFGTCADANKDHACDYGCDKTFGTCEDADKDHACDYGCNKTFGEHKDADKDHACDYGCDKPFGTCEDADKDHACDYGCDKPFGTCEDADKDHACDYGCNKTFGEHEDANKDHACDYGCQEPIGEHKDADKNHACDYGCNKTFGTCEDADRDHDCDYGCDKTFGTCVDDNKDHACDYGCDETFGEHKDTDKNHACDYGCQEAIGTCEDADKDHNCDYGCGKTYGEHKDADKNHACDYGCQEPIGTHADSSTDTDHVCDYGCGATLEDCVDTNKDHACDNGCDKYFGTHADSDTDNDHICDYGCSNTPLNACYGGTASCTAKAKCIVCGEEYGSLLEHVDENHDHKCDRNCGKNDMGTHADSDTDNDHVCDYGCSNTPLNPCYGGTATCTAKAVCVVCGQEYGSLLEHVDANFDHKCDKNCGKNDMGTHADSEIDNDHLCDYGCKETIEECSGGIATCQTQATCEVCGEKYGDLGSHAMSNAWTTENGKHFHKCTVAGCDHTEDEANCSGGTATCTEAAECVVCGTPYGDPKGHTYTQKIETSEYLKEEGTNCQEHHTYYFACKDCEASSKGDTDETFSGSATGDHVMSDAWTTENGKHFHKCTVAGCTHTEDEATCFGGTATCTEAAECVVCGTPYGDPTGHTYTQKIETAQYLKEEGENCQEHHTYYLACEDCGASSKGDTDETFSGSATGNHVISNAWTTENEQHFHKCTVDGCDYIQDKADCSGGTANCTEAAECSECGTPYGDPTGHTYSKKIETAEYLKEEGENCQEHHTYYFACEDCGASSKGDTDTFFSGSATGDHVMSDAWTTKDGKHFHECTVDGCDHVEDTANCSGGEATCFAAAKCSACGKEYAPALVHDYTNTEDNTVRFAATTCQEFTTYWYDCSHCGNSAKDDVNATDKWYTSAEAGNHVMSDAWTTEDGKHFHKCTVAGCDYTSTPENCSGGEATCTEGAKCSTCGKEYEAAIGHDYTNTETNTIRTTATYCKEFNTYWYDCSNCGSSAKDDANATDKWYTSTEAGNHIMSNAWTTENGQHFHKCTVAGCDHTSAPENCSGGEATCTEAAQCSTCGKEYGPAPSHTAGAAATCIAPQTCTVCSVVLTPARGHAWVAPTCLAPQTCTTCGATQGEAGEHNFDGSGVCGTCGKVTVTITFKDGNSSGNIEILPAISGFAGDALPTIPTPTKPNCSFGGWYTDEACTNAFSGTVFSASLTLYAKWTSTVTSDPITVLSFYADSSNISWDYNGPIRQAIEAAGSPDIVCVQLSGARWKTYTPSGYAACYQNDKSGNTRNIIIYYKTSKFTAASSGISQYFNYILLKHTSTNTTFALVNALFAKSVSQQTIHTELWNRINGTWNDAGRGLMPMIITGSFGSNTTTDSVAYKGLTENSQFVDTSNAAKSITATNPTDNGNYIFVSYHMQYSVESYKVMDKKNTSCPLLVSVSLPTVTCSHVLAKTAAVEATCMDAGCKEYYTCTKCGKIFADAQGVVETTVAACAIPAPGRHTAGTPATCTTPQTCIRCDYVFQEALGHNIIVDKAVAATCTTTGLTEGQHCTRCDGETVTQQVIDALDHNAGAEATCTTPQTCTRCGHILQAALGHDIVIDKAVDATCETTGLTHGYHCSRCDDATVEQQVTDALGHKAGAAATCTTPQTCTRCGQVLQSALGHNIVIDEAVAATCTTTGLTEGSHCTRCNGATVEQQVIKALGHNIVIDEAVAATCTTTGLTQGSHCTRCNDETVEQETTAALGHNIVIDEAVAATCTATGLTQGSHCTRCDDETVEQEVTDALGHNTVIDEAVAATCTTTGLTQGSHCTRCNDATVEQQVTKALGHNYIWVVDLQPTFETEGVMHKECTVCHSTRNENTPVDKLACSHELAKTEAVEATCTTAGNKEYYTCSLCEKVYSNAEGTLETTKEDCVIDALGHQAGASATCTTAQTCIRCEHVFQAALGHNTDGFVEHVDATCTKNGVTGGTYCDRCNEGKAAAEAIIEKFGHNTDGSVAHIDATCTEDGVVGGTYCDRCNRGRDAAEKAIPAKGHTEGAAATCTTAQICTVCSAQITAPLGHNYNRTITHIDATCTEDGVTGGAYCSRCNDGRAEAAVVLEKLGHNTDGFVEHVDATCTENGTVGGTYCDRCNNGKAAAETIIMKLGHNAEGFVKHVDPTCTENGVTGGIYCDRCNRGKDAAEAAIPATGHNDLGNVTHVNATCTTTGTVGGKYCTVCDYNRAAAEAVIPATGHTATEAATCTTAQICTVCYTQLAAPLGHTWTNATCAAPKTCSVCHATQGEPIDHQLNGSGVCSMCSQNFTRTVKFLSGNINTGTQLADPVSGIVGEAIPFPAPQMSNYKLNGWYLDSACTKLFNETTFSENLTLYAKWVAASTEQTTVLSYYGNNSSWTNDNGPGKLAIADAASPDVISFRKMGSGWKTINVTNYTAASQNKNTERFITYYRTDKFTEIDNAYTGDYSYIILQRKDGTKFAVVNVLFESGTEEEKLAKLQEGLNNIWNKNGLMPTIIVGDFGSATTTDSAAYKGLTESSQFVDASKAAKSITGVSNTDPGHYAFASYHMQSSVESYKVLAERNAKDPILVTVNLPKACALVKKEATPATCSTMGNKEYYYCSTCGKIYLDAMGTREVTAADCMIPALDHNWTDATCTAPKTCSTCGVTEGVALDHVWTNACDITCNNNCGTTRIVEHDYEWVIDTPPTVTTEGVKHEECTVCHVKRSEYTPVDKLTCSHALVKTEATAATCTTTGNKEYYTCSICRKVYSDAAGTLETTVANSQVAVLAHTWANATCTAPKTCSVCSTTEGEALGHSWTEATCTAPRTCSVCRATQGEPISHKINDASICTLCGGYFLRTINFKGGKLSSGTYAYDNAQIAASINGLVGEKFSYPEITLQLKGYNFAGWCTDYACTKSYTGTTFSEDMTLYAKWVSNADRIVTVMSFNVKTGGSLSKSSVVTGTIRDANPDVFGVQEDDGLWTTTLKSEFKDYTSVGKSSGDGESCTVFYRTSMFNCLESGTKWLSNTPDKQSAYSYTEGGKTYSENYNRIMTYVVLQRKDNGAKFLYVNTHLDNNGKNEHDIAEKIREGEVHNMMKIINGITSRFGNIPVIANGDFNVLPFVRLAYNAMTGTYGYLDASRIAKEGGPSTTFTESSDENSGVILDYIFVSPNLNGYVETYYVCPAKRNGKWVSDHNAIVAKIAIP